MNQWELNILHKQKKNRETTSLQFNDVDVVYISLCKIIIKKWDWWLYTGDNEKIMIKLYDNLIIIIFLYSIYLLIVFLVNKTWFRWIYAAFLKI